MRSHAANPVAVPLGDDVIRVFFGSRDDNQRSHIWYLDIELKCDKFNLIGLAKDPVLNPGNLGAFDDSGVSIGCVVQNNLVSNLYFMGWNLGVTVPWRNSIGLALDYNSSGKYQKYSVAPIFDRNHYDPFTISYPCVMQDDGIWKMWYGSNLSWGKQQSDMDHVIKYAWSKDGIYWNTKGEISLNLILPEEYALCRPWVIKENGIYKMWFCFRGDSYRIGYCESKNGIDFIRKPGNVIEVSKSGWDSEMVSYPCLLKHKNKMYMFYNGNGYGRTGFGVAMSNVEAD
jgi:hypothetical protein